MADIYDQFLVKGPAPKRAPQRFNTIAEYNQYKSYMADQNKAKKKKDEGFDIRSLLSEALGTVGTVGGAVLGGPVGAGIGGALGSGFGSALEQQVIKGKVDAGEALGEGALGGVLGYGPLRALKGVAGLAKGGVSATRAIPGVAGLGAKSAGRTALETAIGEVGETTAKKAPNYLARETVKNFGRSTGISPTVALQGSKPLGQTGAKKLQEFGLKKAILGTADEPYKVMTNAETFLKQTGEQIGQAVKQPGIVNNKTLTKNLTAELKASFDDVLPANWQKDTFAQNLLKKAQTANTPEKLWNLRKLVEKNVSYIANPDAATAMKTQIATQARGILNNNLKKSAPALGSLFDDYKNTSKIVELATKAANNPSGIKILGLNAGGPMISRAQGLLGKAEGVLAGQTVKSAAPAAQAAAQVGKIGLAEALPYGAVRQGVISPMLRGGFSQQEPTQLEGALGQTQGIDPTQQGGQDMGGQSMNPYGKANLIADIQRDPQNAQDYIKTYQLMQEIFPEQSANTLSLSDTAIKSVNDLQKGLQDIQQLRDQISGSDAVGPVIGQLRGMNPWDTDAQSLQANINRVKQVIGKALEGGVLRKEDEEKYKLILPTIGDTKEVAANKLAALEQALSTDIENYIGLQQTYGKGAGQALSFENALANSQTGTIY